MGRLLNKGETAMIIEIRSAEGGKHAELLVEDQFAIYCKLAIRRFL